jgi:hypothetical protein
MRKKDTNSIAYLFNEMDPSEEVEFERSLKNNENLLIEVESLRKVNQKLSSLPQFSASAKVLDEIYLEAGNRVVKQKSDWKKPIYYAAAAILIAGLTGSVLFLDQGSQNSDAERAMAGSNNFLYQQSKSSDNITQSRADVEPWIDNNDILHFNDRFQPSESASIDSLFKNSYQRLTPVTDPIHTRLYQRNLQLTGSRQ